MYTISAYLSFSCVTSFVIPVKQQQPAGLYTKNGLSFNVVPVTYGGGSGYPDEVV